MIEHDSIQFDVGPDSAVAPDISTPALGEPGQPHCLAQGGFLPTMAARILCEASVFVGPHQPIVVRFSNCSGRPDVADPEAYAEAEASQRGLAVKSELSSDGALDVLAHFLLQHAIARTLLSTRKAAPAGYASITNFGVYAFWLGSRRQLRLAVCFGFVAIAGERHLSPEVGRQQGPDYLAEEIRERVGRAMVQP